jgi:hypothetical protein
LLRSETLEYLLLAQKSIDFSSQVHRLRSPLKQI